MTKEEIISIMLEINRPNQAVWSIDEEALEQWLPLLQATAAAEREAAVLAKEALDEMQRLTESEYRGQE